MPSLVSPAVTSNFLWPHGLQPDSLLCPWNSPGKNTGVGCHSLFQGIFPTQGSNLGLLHCRQILYHLSCQGGPRGQSRWLTTRCWAQRPRTLPQGGEALVISRSVAPGNEAEARLQLKPFFAQVFTHPTLLPSQTSPGSLIPINSLQKKPLLILLLGT